MRPTPTAVLMAQGKEEKKIPVMKMSGLGVSIKHPRVDEEQQKRTVSTVQQNAQPEEDFIFNEKDVITIGRNMPAAYHRSRLLLPNVCK